METKEAIRLNLKVHPDKDPALFQLMSSISKDSRTRRIMNLANLGLLAEAVGLNAFEKSAVQSNVSRDVIPESDAAEIGAVKQLQDIPASVKPVSGIVLEAGEADALGDMFN